MTIPLVILRADKLSLLLPTVQLFVAEGPCQCLDRHAAGFDEQVGSSRPVSGLSETIIS